MGRFIPFFILSLSLLTGAASVARAANADHFRLGSALEEESDWLEPALELEAILVEGNESTSQRIIRRELVLRVGDPFNERLARISRQRLINLGYFRSVDFRLSKGTQQGKVVLNIRVVERETTLIGEASLGGSAQRKVGGAQGFSAGGLSVSDINLFGSGQSLTATLQANRPNRLMAGVRWAEPRLFASGWGLHAEYFFIRRDDFFSEDLQSGAPIEAGDLLELRTDRQGLVLGGRYRLSAFNAIGFEYETNRLFSRYAGGNLADLNRRLKRGASQLTLLRVDFLRDSRNDPFLPTEGQTIRFYYEWGARQLGSHYNYNQAGLELAQYLPIFDDHSLALTVKSAYSDTTRPFFVGFAPADLLANDGLDPEEIEREGITDRTLLLSQEYKPSFASLDLTYGFPIYSWTGPTLYRIRGSLSAGVFDSWDKDEAFFEELFVPTGLSLYLDTAYGVINFRFTLNFAVSGDRFENLSRF